MVDTQDLIAAIKARIDGADQLGYRIMVSLTDTDDTITLSDSDNGIIVEAGGNEADTTVKLSSDNLQKLIDGKLNPLIAYSTGRLKVDGSQGVALKLVGLLQGDD